MVDQGVASEWLESMLVLQGADVAPQRRMTINDAVKILASSTSYAKYARSGGVTLR